MAGKIDQDLAEAQRVAAQVAAGQVGGKVDGERQALFAGLGAEHLGHIVERIANLQREVFEYQALGFDLFQGFFFAKPEDYRPATQRIFHAPGLASCVELPVVK